MLQIDEDMIKSRADIKVVGVGGGGSNAIKTMYQSGLSGVQFIAVNTDLQALEEHENLDSAIQLGGKLTKGLGAGANPEIGRQAAIESCDKIVSALKGADMVFITAGMGGGTGTGASGVIARIAKEQGALTVGVVTRPFFFEGQRRARHAETGIRFLKENVDTLIVIPNQKLLNTENENVSLLSAFKSVDNILLKAVKGIVDLINKKGLINLDFADIKTIMSEKGLAIIGTGSAKGQDRALSAGRKAISSPLLEDADFKGAEGLIINITAGPDLSLKEVQEMAELITKSAHPHAEIIFGAIVDPNESSDEVTVTVIATGFESSKKTEKIKTAKGEHEPSSEGTAQDTTPTENLAFSESSAQEGNNSTQNDKPEKTSFSPPATGQNKSGKLPKDILLEKARAYRLQKDQNPPPRPEQLSMNITVNKKEKEEKAPFTKTRGGSLISLFKKPEKDHDL